MILFLYQVLHEVVNKIFFTAIFKQKSTTQYDTISQEDYELLAVCLHASYYSLVVCNRADVFPIRRNPIRRN